MKNDNPATISGTITLAASVPGSAGRWESTAIINDERRRQIIWDSKSKLTTVYGESGELIAWTERDAQKFRQVVLASGVRPDVAIEDKWFSRVIWIEGTKYKAVMTLHGRRREFGNERLLLTHRDFSSEARFQCVPELEAAALIVAFEVYCVPNCSGK